MALSFERADIEWAGFHSFGNLAPNFWFQRFVAASNPDDLSLLGLPQPGHPVWTPDVIDQFSAHVPRPGCVRLAPRGRLTSPRCRWAEFSWRGGNGGVLRG